MEFRHSSQGRMDLVGCGTLFIVSPSGGESVFCGYLGDEVIRRTFYHDGHTRRFRKGPHPPQAREPQQPRASSKSTRNERIIHGLCQSEGHTPFPYVISTVSSEASRTRLRTIETMMIFARKATVATMAATPPRPNVRREGSLEVPLRPLHHMKIAVRSARKANPAAAKDVMRMGG